ncbi:MAG TPA: thiamine phosphate synthase [Bacteroidia bacterium]|jgi:thiamine-phosphate pyrophosphorylase|nr:thiamine phosphate synthase [Bacteroidia bacterium]
MTANFKLIVITPEKGITGEADTITRLFEAGLQILHIRKHNHIRQEIKNLLTDIPQKFHKDIVIHQHYDLLNEYDLKGAHLPENFRMEGDFGGIKNIISTSFHKLVDITRERANFEYAFFSPVFRSISKKDHESSVNLDTVKTFLQSANSNIRFPIIALGGINEETIKQAKEMRFNGAACIGQIWENSNPIGEFKKLQKLAEN